jgi:hypothetical protein
MAVLANTLRDAMTTVLREALDGPPQSGAYFLNHGDRGLLASLDALSAQEASARPDGRASVAAHTDHLRYGLELLNRWAVGEQDPWHDANFATSWKRQQVTEEEWRTLRQALAKESRAWLETIGEPRDWESAALTEAFASVVHLGYHLGAIRQIARAASGPPAGD